MKYCRQCGALLPQRKPEKGEIYVAEKNIDHFTKYLTEEGDFLAIDTRKSIERIMHESRLCLSGEFTWDNALCKHCKAK